MCSLGLIIVHLLMAHRGYRNVLISGEAIKKACPLHSTQGSPDFVGVFRRIKIANSCKRFEDILWRFLSSETANSRVYDAHT